MSFFGFSGFSDIFLYLKSENPQTGIYGALGGGIFSPVDPCGVWGQVCPCYGIITHLKAFKRRFAPLWVLLPLYHITGIYGRLNALQGVRPKGAYKEIYPDGGRPDTNPHNAIIPPFCPVSCVGW